MRTIQRVVEALNDEEGVRRLGQALWMMVGKPVDRARLFWARSLLGCDGDRLSWAALVECRAVSEIDQHLKPEVAADLLCSIWGTRRPQPDTGRLIWTLPTQLKLPKIEESYCRAAELE